MPARILVVDDEPKLLELVRWILERSGFEVLEVQDGREAIRKVQEELPSLVLLDVMMPNMNGFETLREIRKFSNVPVIMLTVQASETDKVHGLELGADDYITKPFSHRELVSRIRAVLRRSQMPPHSDQRLIRVDDRLSIDFDRREVVVNGRSIKLRPTEYRLLYHLVNNAGRLLTHETLLTKVWGREYRDDSQLLRLYITYLRQKIEEDPSHPKYILNERGIGYRFADLQSPA
jgi:two-component system KDP operon response regulator KdpE